MTVKVTVAADKNYEALAEVFITVAISESSPGGGGGGGGGSDDDGSGDGDSVDKVQQVADKINALPDTVTEKDVEEVKAAENAYNDLTDAEKAMIPADTKAKLDAAVKAARSYQMGEDGTALGKGASYEAAEAAILGMTSDTDPAGSKFHPLKLNSKKQTKKTVTTRWTKLSDAANYVLFGSRSGEENEMKRLAMTEKTSLKVRKIEGKKLKKGTYYKFIVVALDKDNDVISTSKVIHVATKGVKKNSNYTKLKVKTPKGSEAALEAGKTVSIKVAQKKARKTRVRKLLGLRFESSDEGVATVSGTGVITGVSAGSCQIFVYMQNGLYRTVKVTVR